ncbi:MAG TPA: arsenate reductase ArsC [Chroococcales cyanobacterium]
MKVIFACVHNAGRSQMAAAFYNALAGGGAVSAGTQPGERVHPQVVEVMAEAGIDLSSSKPQLLTDELVRDADLLVTMGCGEACPLLPGLKSDDWPIEDPKGKSLETVRAIRENIKERVLSLIQASTAERIKT